MTMASRKDAGFRSRTVGAGKGTATAGGAGDNVAVNGAWVDRNVATGIPDSGKLVVICDTTLTAGQTLSMRAKLQDADDNAGTGAADVVDTLQVTDTGVQTGVASATGQVTFEMDVSFVKLRRFVRAVITPDLSNANTDTVNWQAAWIFFGGDRGPITRSAI